MQRNMQSRTAMYRARQRRRRRWYKVVSVLACVVVFCTTYALILPAITMEAGQVLDCRYAVHTHTDACYDGEKNLICGQADFVVHTHTDDCYDENGDLACPLPEIEAHTHTDDCYTVTHALTCGQTEDLGHSHTDDCYTWTETLTCENESEDHTHTDECYQQKQVLTCTEEERPVGHVHTDACYTETRELTCGQDEIILHTHTEACYDGDGNLTCDRLEVLEHTHTDDCFVLADAGIMPLAATDEDAATDAGNTFTLTYNNHTITFRVVDEDGNAIKTERENITGEGATLYKFSEIAPEIDGYTYSGAKYGNDTVVSVATTGFTTDFNTAFRIYMNDPIESGKWFTKNTDTVTLIYTPRNTFTLTYTYTDTNGQEVASTVTFHVEDSLGNAIPGDYSAKNITAQDATRYIFGAASEESQEENTDEKTSVVQNIAPGIEDYSFSGATKVTGTTASNDRKSWSTIYSLATKGYTPPKTSEDVEEGVWFYAEEPIEKTSSKLSWGAGTYDVTLTYAPVNALVYDLNLPSMSSKGTGWQTEPTITSATQSLNEATALYGQPNGYYEAGTAGIEGLYRFNVGLVNDMTDSPAYQDGIMGSTWYGEERFDGWTYTVDGTTYLFEPEAEITTANGTRTVTAAKKITTESGVDTITAIETPVTVTLPDGAKLTGHWTEVSNVVTFFVNYKGTILDTEGDVTGRRQDTFTKSVAVGHVFYGKAKVGTDGTFAAGANQQIVSAISPDFTQQFNPDNPETQIVIEYLRECTGTNPDAEVGPNGPVEGTNYVTSMQLNSHGANSAMVAANTLKLLKETGRTIQVATGSGTNPTIDSNLCDEDHYEIRWYVLKEQTDTWHVDGVLVAKTSEIAVTKTFSGLSTTQAATLLNGTSPFQIDTKLGTGDSAQNYLTITKTPVEGQYEYSGSDATVGLPNSYHWTFHAITDEKYTMTEENYELKDYDVSSIVVHYYTDDSGAQRVVYEDDDSTSSFVSSVTGGKTSAVSFNNFYTPTGTGAMAIVKRDSTTSDTDTYGLLQGAEFTLYTDENCQNVAKDSNNKNLIVTTNANGTAYFSGMAVGVYYLKETRAPEGYIINDTVYKIVVEEVTTEDNKSKVTVTLYEPDTTTDDWVKSTILYDGGIKTSYTVKNTAETSTITFTKTFSGLTLSELDTLYQASKADNANPNARPSGYYIQLQGPIGGTGDVEAGGEANVFLTLQEAQRSQDGYTFTWTIHNLAVAKTVTGEDGSTTTQPITYTITERNYMLSNYVDVVVTAKLGSGNLADVPEGNAEDGGPYLYIDRQTTAADTTAEINRVTFSANGSNVVRLSNHYTNTFTLRLKKTDSKTGAALANAEFKIYGPFAESTNSTDKFTYTDENGVQQTVYYIKTITSGTDGYAALDDLRLSNGENTFVYILDESRAPDGYAAAKPQVVTVTVNGGVITTPTGSNYLAGILEYSAPNTREEDYVHAALDTQKVWVPEAPEGTTVTLELYRVTHAVRNTELPKEVDAVLVKTITLDGKIDTEPSEEEWDEDTLSKDKIQVYESAPWVATWMNLYSASREYTDTNPEHYHYFVREVTQVNGYATSYTCYDAKGKEPTGAQQKLELEDGTVIIGVLLADMDEAYTVTVKNQSGYELPATGGEGTFPYAMGGTLLAAGSLLLGYLLRRKRERRFT